MYVYVCTHIYKRVICYPREGDAGGDDARRGDDVLLVSQELRALVAVLREQRRREPVYG